jgi:hypothetical protein
MPETPRQEEYGSKAALRVCKVTQRPRAAKACPLPTYLLRPSERHATAVGQPEVEPVSGYAVTQCCAFLIMSPVAFIRSVP